MKTIVEMCPNCYGTHYNKVEAIQCEQAQLQRDALPPPIGRDTKCHWCGKYHISSAEKAQCMLDNCG